MKHFIKYGFLLFLLTFTKAMVWAQDSSQSATSTTTSTTTTTQQIWYAQPWVWIVGGIVLILLIIALTRGNSSNSKRTDKVTITKTTSSDSV